jgi:hypothetical protein
MLAQEYRLMRGEEVLGTLRPNGGDFPWVFCKFEPAEAFEEVRALFDEFTRLADGEDFEAQDESFARIESLGLRLESSEGSRDFGEFFIEIRGDEASIR